MPYTASLFTVVRAFVGFVAVAGFLFGQLFFGTFSLAHTAAGVAGILAAVASSRSFTQTHAGRVVVVTCAVLGVCGVIFSAYTYYTEFNIPGNNFGWFLAGPFVLGLAVIGLSAVPHASRLFRSTGHNGG